jgi:membrane protein YdbS with pleckstrin-like domain
MAQSPSVCGNCGRTIGKLEQPRQWQEHNVCFECYERLARAAGENPVPAGAHITLQASSGADVEWHGCPSMIPFLPLYALLAVLTATALWLSWVWSIYYLLLFPVFLILFISWEARRRSIRFTITSKSVIAEEGIVGRRRRELRISDIREATVNQTFIGRLLRVGDVGIDTAASPGVEIEMKGIRRPAEVLALLNSLRG